MKRKGFSEEQIVGVLKEHEAGVKTADLCRKHGISDATFYNWKSKYGGLDVSEARRLRSLEGENAKLKRLLADAMLDNAALKYLLTKNGDARGEARGRVSSAKGSPDERAAGVPCDRLPAYDDPLPGPAAGRSQAARASGGAGAGWPAARQVPERDDVHVTRPGTRSARGLAARLQQRPAALRHRLADAGCLCSTVHRATGPNRCACWGLRVSARCIFVLRGTFKRQGEPVLSS